MIRPMRAQIVIACLLASLTQACTLRPLSQQATMQVDSVALSGTIAGAAQAQPFCLHLAHDDRFWVVYSHIGLKAWVTEGRCSDAGAERPVDSLQLTWQQDWSDAHHHKACSDTARCELSAHDVIVGQPLVCAAARARVGNQVAMVTTNANRCP